MEDFKNGGSLILPTKKTETRHAKMSLHGESGHESLKS